MRTINPSVYALIIAAPALAACGPAAEEKCPNFKITGEVDKATPGTVTFTLSPARDGLTYSWSTAVGTIRANGGAAIVVEGVPSGEYATVTVEIAGTDASCPVGSNIASGSAQLP